MWVRTDVVGNVLLPIEVDEGQRVWRASPPSAAVGQAAASSQQPPSGTPPAGGWAAHLPTVSINPAYKSAVVPSPAGAGARTGKWPVTFGAWGVEATNFAEFLDNKGAHRITITTTITIIIIILWSVLRCSAGVKGEGFKDAMRGVKRFLHIITLDGSLVKEPDVDKAETLAAVYAGRLLNEIFALPILNPNITWTPKLIAGLRLYAKYLLTVSEHAALVQDSDFYAKCTSAIQNIERFLDNNLQKKIGVARRDRKADRRRFDTDILRQWPTKVEIQQAIQQAMMTLKYIVALQLSDLPIGMRALANACLAGIIWLNGFGGRKKEWECMQRAYVRNQFALGLDWLECSEFKTANTYGTLGKWVAPGTAEAISCYQDRLPAPEGWEPMFVPAKATTGKLNLSNDFARSPLNHDHNHHRHHLLLLLLPL